MYSRSTGEVNSNTVTSSLLQKRTRLPTHAHEVRALTFQVTDNFGSNDVLPCGAYGPWFGTLGMVVYLFTVKMKSNEGKKGCYNNEREINENLA